MHDAVLQRLEDPEQAYDLPGDERLTLARYAAGAPIEMYIDHVAVGGTLPVMPLFFLSDRYIDVPLDAANAQAFHSMPAFWRDVLEGRPA